MLDHAAILVLIAGTYTPLPWSTYAALGGWSLFGIIWGLAILGILIEVTRLRRYRAGLILLYGDHGVGGGGRHPADAGQCGQRRPALLAGGLAYTGGIVFYLWKTSVQPCHLASLCTGRQHLALFRDSLLCSSSSERDRIQWVTASVLRHNRFIDGYCHHDYLPAGPTDYD